MSATVSKKDSALSLDIEAALKRKLELLAKRQRLSMSHVVREALRKYLESQEAA